MLSGSRNIDVIMNQEDLPTRELEMSKRITSRPTVVSCLIAAIGLVTVTPALAYSGSGDTESPDSDSWTEAAVDSYAQDHGVTRAHATAAIFDQMALTDAINSNGVVPGETADIWIEHGRDQQRIVFKTQDDDAATAIETLDLSDSTTVYREDTNVSADDLTITPEVHRIVRDEAPGVQGLYVRDSDHALVVETIDERSDVSTEAIEAATDFPSVVVNEVPVGSDQIQIIAGAGLSSCTPGFPATYQSYIGYFTAGHCGASQTTYSNTAGTGVSTPGTRRAVNHGANADIGFLSVSSGNTLTTGLYGATYTNYGPPNSVPVGVTVCHRGKTSGWQCGGVASISYAPTWSGACPGTTCNAVFVGSSGFRVREVSWLTACWVRAVGGPWVRMGVLKPTHPSTQGPTCGIYLLRSCWLSCCRCHLPHSRAGGEHHGREYRGRGGDGHRGRTSAGAGVLPELRGRGAPA